MRGTEVAIIVLVLCAGARLDGQSRRATILLSQAVDGALAKCSLQGEGARPFHLYISVSEPENTSSPYQGTIEEWWESSSRWRREVSAKGGLHQIIVVTDGKKTERDEGDYFPLWLRNFVAAAFEIVPDAAAWKGSGGTVAQIAATGGENSGTCAHAKFSIGSGVSATDAFAGICFDGAGRVKSYFGPRYSMEVSDYRAFGKKQIARRFAGYPEPGTHLVGEVARLEEMPKDASGTLFTPLPTDDDRFQSVAVSSVQMEQLMAGNKPVHWPTVRSGNTHGQLAMYVSIDTTGHVRETWPLNSDNAGLEDPAREQVRHWTIRPAIANGKPVQVDGGMGFVFDTKVGDPLPELNDAEVRALATKIVEPVWPKDAGHGEVAVLDIGVNEEGKLTGETYTKVPSKLQGALMGAIAQWKFQPLIRDGKPQYFHGILKFVVP